MKLICESDNFKDYLLELDEVDFSHLSIREKVNELLNPLNNEVEIVKRAYEFVRDSIAHSWDIQSSRITCKASEVLYFKEGICYAKSNLLAALLRSKGIPTGFCYQRLFNDLTPDKRCVIHALNAVYLKSLGRWIRLDARGNKAGVDAQFSVDEEKLAFSAQERYDEKDYPIIYAKPNYKTISTLKENTDCIKMYLHYLPDEL